MSPYKWQCYYQEDRIESKLSYVAEFEPWDWIVGTG
ncbi:MAG: cache domain-containing protein, partial [bacterium]